MRFRLMSTSFERESTMFTKEKYMNCRADIDDALNSSEFCIQAMYATGNPGFQVHIMKLDENDNPGEISNDDVNFLKRRFEPLDFTVKFKRVRQFTPFPSFRNHHPIDIAEFNSVC